METSDSECFESADEEFFDDEKFESKKTLSLINEQLKILKLSEDIKTETSVANEDTKFKNIFAKNDYVNKSETIDTASKESLTEKVKKIEHTTQFIKEHLRAEGLKDKQLTTSDWVNSSTKISVREVLEDIDFERPLILEKEHVPPEVHVKTQDGKCAELEKNKLSKNDQLENSTGENLWEGDGWEIEEEIEVPSILEEAINVKDPLSTSSENMWDNQDWEEVDEPQLEQNILQNKQNQNTNDSWSSWGNWGVTSLLSSATQSVSTITNQVSQGLSIVLENGMGIPSPEELAKINHKEVETYEKLQDHSESTETDLQEHPKGFVFGNLGNLVSGVSNITKFVESTSTKVISGGLETLETIGKKTMEVLQDGDPGLKKKRAFLKLEQEKPVLSQVLREAKERAEQETRELENQTKQLVKKINYEALFDDFHGLVHLEALEMLSKQCEIKLKTVCDNCSGDAAIDIQETMEQIKELCELPDEDEDEQLSSDDIKEKIHSAIQDINVNISYDRLINTWEETECWLDNVKVNICSEDELHQQAIETLAQLTALVVEQYHKAGELLLIKDHHSTADEADSLVQ